jgi:hypothetical protein
MAFFKVLAAWVVCLLSLAQVASFAAPATDEPAGEGGNVTIYNLDSTSRSANIAIDGAIDKAVAARAIELIKFLRPDHDEVTIYLNSPGGDAAAAMDIGQEIKRQSILTAMEDHAECLGACVLVLAAGARRSPVPDKVGLYRLADKNPALAKRVQTYLTRIGMPDRLYQEMMQRTPSKMLVLDAPRLKSLRLEGIDPAYEKWLRENSDQPSGDQQQMQFVPPSRPD